MAKISPFQQVHQRLGAAFEEFDGWQLPRDFGSPQSEQAALQSECAALDLSSFGRISLKGPGAEQLATEAGICPEQPITEGRWSWAKMNNQTNPMRLRIGKILGEVVILTLPGQDQAILTALRQTAEHGFADTAVIDLSDNTAMLGLYGPSALESVLPILPFEMDPLEPGGIIRVSIFMMNLILFRGSWLDAEGLELLCPASAGPLAAGAIAKARDKHKITPAGMLALREALKNKDLL